MTNKLTPPADLDPTKLYTPHEVKQWAAEWAAYRDFIAGEEQRQRVKDATEKAAANRVLTEAEYYEWSLKRHEEAQAKLVEREAAAKAKADEQAAYLASLPEVADVCEASEFLFLMKCQHWMVQGYTVADDSISYFVPGCFAVRLHRPTATTRSK